MSAGQLSPFRTSSSALKGHLTPAVQRADALLGEVGYSVDRVTKALGDVRKSLYLVSQQVWSDKCVYCACRNDCMFIFDRCI